MNDHVEQAKNLVALGKIAEAQGYLVRACRDAPNDIELQLNAAVFSFNEQWLNSDTVEIIHRCLETNPELPDLWFMYAHTCFASDSGDLNDCRGVNAAIKSLTLNPENLPPYHTLINLYLLKQRYLEAYMASCAMAEKAGENDGTAKSLVGFSKRFLEPNRIPYIGFIIDGAQLAYVLTTITPQSITASICYHGGHIDEHNELRYAREFVGQADKILEIGTHCGNHTAYFLNFLVPSRYLGIEGHPKHAEITRQVTMVNKSAGIPCETDVMNIWADSACGSIRIHNHDVPRRPLDQVTDGSWDFIRIDSCGAGVDALYGAEGILCNGRPKLMIRTEKESGKDVIEWLKARGYTLINTISNGTRHNHFLDGVPKG